MVQDVHGPGQGQPDAAGLERQWEHWDSFVLERRAARPSRVVD
jgi:hypothetical protein